MPDYYGNNTGSLLSMLEVMLHSQEKKSFWHGLEKRYVKQGVSKNLNLWNQAIFRNLHDLDSGGLLISVPVG